MSAAAAGLLADDERFDGLSAVEQLVLWSMRVWVIGLQRRVPVDRPIRDAYARFGAAEAAPLVDGAMNAVARGAVRPIDVRCACSRAVSGDERCLLDGLWSGRVGEEDGAAGLAGLLRPDEAARAGFALECLGRLLVDAALPDAAFPGGAAGVPGRDGRLRPVTLH